MKNFKLFLLACLLSSSFGLGMQKEKQHQKEISKPITVHAHYNFNSDRTKIHPLVLQSNNNGVQKHNVFSPERLINQQIRGSHQLALPLAKQHEQFLIKVKQDFLTSTKFKADTFAQLTKANVEKIKNLSPCEVINQKSIYERNLVQAINAHGKLLNKISNETRMMLEIEAKTSVQHAAEAMEARVPKTGARIVCYEEAAMIKDLEVTIDVCKQAIKDCDQRIESIKAGIIQKIQPIAEKMSVQELENEKIPYLERELVKIGTMIQRYEKDSIKLAEYRNQHFIILTQREYLEKVVQARRAEQRVKSLIESQKLLSEVWGKEGTIEDQQLLKIIDATIVEKATSSHNVNQLLHAQSKSLLTSIGVDANAYEKRFAIDGVQAHLWNEANAQLNKVASLYVQGAADAQIKKYMDNLAKMHCQTIDIIREGKPQDAIAAFKASSVLQKITLLACDSKITGAIAPAQLDMILTPAAQLSQAGFSAAKKGHFENSITIAGVAHGIINYTKAFTTRLDEISKNIAQANQALAKGLAQGALKGLENCGQAIMHPLDFSKKALQHGVQLAHALGEVESLGILTLNDKAIIEKIVTHGTAFTKTLQEATQQFKALPLNIQAEKIGLFIGQSATETLAFEKTCSALSAATKLVVSKTSSLLTKCGSLESVVTAQKNLIKAEGELVAIFDIKSSGMTQNLSTVQATVTTEYVAQKLSQSKDLQSLEERIQDLNRVVPDIRYGSLEAAVNDSKSMFKLQEAAEKSYEAIRGSATDVQKISNNTGIQISTIQEIKNHLFIQQHTLSSGIGRFNADADIAAAWERLCDGKFVQSDLKLLQHEFAESLIMRSENHPYKIVHDIIDNIFDKKYNWQNHI